MTNKRRQKETERIYVDVLRSHLGQHFPRGKLSCHEQPDFIAGSGDTAIGIEVREVYREYTPNGNNPAKEHQNHCSIVQNAEGLYNANNGRSVRVVVRFKPRAEITKAKAKRIAECLHEVVSTSVNKRATNFVLEANDLPAPLSSAIELVHVFPLDKPQQSVWQGIVLSEIHEITPEQIQEVLDEKEPRLADYRKACRANWLLLVIPGRRPGGNLSLTSRASQEPYCSSFDRAFLLDYFEKRLVELPLKSKYLGRPDPNTPLG